MNATIVSDPAARFSDLLKKLDSAVHRAPKADRSKVMGLVLEEFWRIARMTDANLLDAHRRMNGALSDAEADAILAEIDRRGLKLMAQPMHGSTA